MGSYAYAAALWGEGWRQANPTSSVEEGDGGRAGLGAGQGWRPASIGRSVHGQDGRAVAAEEAD